MGGDNGACDCVTHSRGGRQPPVGILPLCPVEGIRSSARLCLGFQVAGEHKYHPECFVCLSCKVVIEDRDTYALVERSKLYW